jgi:type VI secretion system protein ImpL
MTRLPWPTLLRWTLSLVCSLLLTLLIWFLGPLIGFGDTRPLETTAARMAVTAVVLAAWAGFAAYAAWRRWRRVRDMTRGMTEAGDQTAGSREIAVLRRDMEQAIGKLRLRGGRGSALHDLPWYMLIGPPGSGKTTALVNSGLRFPLAETIGRKPVHGVGGTRYCDWWFTDEAVLIDTAGRYTTQDSDAEADSAAWFGFLDLLKRNRPRQPINGALVAISLADVAGNDAAMRTRHAQAIRSRLGQFYERLGIRVPVYVLFTKADLIAGFTEFFSDLGKEQREQIWGATLPLDDSLDEAPFERFPREFDLLVARLQDRVLERLDAEPSGERRAAIFGFPAQFASLREPIADFLSEVFQPSRFEEKLLFRGAYFTSGTQTGNPIDRLTATMARNYGLAETAARPSEASGRSYFLTRLLRDVVFPEAGLVGSDPKVLRRNLLLRRASYAAAAAILVMASAGWYVSYARNSTLIGEAEAAADAYRGVFGTDMRLSPNGDLGPVLTALDHLRDMPAGYAGRDAAVPASMTLGLYQGEKLAEGAGDAYRRALDHYFLPQLLVRLEHYLRSALGRPEDVYPLLQVYLMLGGQGPFDKDAVRRWAVSDWNLAIPGASGEPVRNRLAGHLDALLEAPPGTVAPLDQALVQQARAELLRIPLAERAYGAARRTAAQNVPPEWRIMDHAGPAAGHVFTRRSGLALSTGVAGLFTHAGFHGTFLPLLDRLVEQVAGEAWILGVSSSPGRSGADTGARLREEVLALYYNDFSRQWDGMLADIQLVTFRSIDEAATMLNAAAGPMSPLKLLIQAVARETDLAAAPAGTSATAIADTVAEAGMNLAGPLMPNGPAQLPGQPISDRYRPVRDLAFGQNGSPPGIEQVLASLDALYQQVARAAGLPGDGEADSAGTARLARQIEATAARLPEPLKGWLSGVGSQTSAAALGTLRSGLDARWKAEVLPLCTEVVEGRFPVKRSSRIDASLTDFARLFAPGGLLDGFFSANLRNYVDTTGASWRWQPGGKEIGIPDAVLAQFQRAAAIRDTFFPLGGQTPLLRLTLTPTRLDRRLQAVAFDLEGQKIGFGSGGPPSATLQWPPQLGTNEASVEFQPADGGPPPKLSVRGPWSVLRLLGAARLRAGASPDRVEATFSIGGYQAVFDLRTGGSGNPLMLREMEAFACPISL